MNKLFFQSTDEIRLKYKIQLMKNIGYEINEDICKIWINRHDFYNALNGDVLDEFYQILLSLSKKQIKIIILKSNHPKSFISGADIKEMNIMTQNEFEQFLCKGQQISSLLETSKFISIAAVDGYALGGGFELALACNFIFASENAKFGFPETKLGIIPGFGGTQRLARLINPRKAFELISTNRIISSKEAVQMGIINFVAKKDGLYTYVEDHSHKFSVMSQDALYNLKKSITVGSNLSIYDSILFERSLCVESFCSKNRLEGMNAFIEKRKPQFS